MALELPKLPSRAEVGYLSPELDEGEKIAFNDGVAVSILPPPPQPVVPDWSQIKSIRKYFNRAGYEVFPAWFYHPTDKPRLMKDKKQALDELGVFYRDATDDERSRYGVRAVWDSREGSKWRSNPYPKDTQFDANAQIQGKNIVRPDQPQSPALMRELAATVAGIVAQSLQKDGPTAPANVDPKDWHEFLEFKAWQKSQEAIVTVAEKAVQPQTMATTAEEKLESQAAQSILDELVPHATNALNDTPVPDERASLLAEAERKGIKIDKRWGLERLRMEVNAKAA